MATTYMNYERMRQISSGFQEASTFLKTVSQVLEGCMMTLRMTAFIGLVGGAVVERYLSVLKPRVDEMSVRFQETSEKLDQAIANYQAAEQAGDSFS